MEHLTGIVDARLGEGKNVPATRSKSLLARADAISAHTEDYPPGLLSQIAVKFSETKKSLTESNEKVIELEKLVNRLRDAADFGERT